MSNVGVSIDSSGIDNILRTLDDDEFRKKTVMKGLEAGANVLKDSTMENMRSSWVGSTHYSKYVGGPIYTGVNIKKDKAYGEVIVDILKGDWRIRFYETQINQRKTRKGYNRGVVPAYHFFRNARSNSAQEISEAINKRVSEELNKV